MACGSIILERKFVRSAGVVGHIEDIAVSKSMQGRKLGIRIINSLEEIGRVMGCYKIILDCSKDNVGELFGAVRCVSQDAYRVVQPSTRNAGRSKISGRKRKLIGSFS